jgi:mannose-1-phosphate guanylyltransferase
MAGGIGSRFWPMSRTNYPKQFIDILGLGDTLLQLTYKRFLKLCPPENILVVTNDIYKDLVKEQLPKLSDNQILLEPSRRNTAPCIAYACYKINAQNPDAKIVVSPADHLILKEETFVKAINSCFRKAETEDCLVTLGIKPSRPDTGYGYIQFIESLGPETDKRIKKVKTFTEKPDLEMAKFFMQSGDFLWNSGIFIWSAKSILKAFEIHMPETAVLFKEGESIYNTDKEIEFIKGVYSVCKNISIDYGVMEKASNVYVRSSIIGWSDLGTYGSLYTHIPKDDNQNAVINKNALMYKSEKCIISAPKQKLLVIEGLKDYIIVDTKDALLVCNKDSAQNVKKNGGYFKKR